MSRKNQDYLSKRLESLENQWRDFAERHQVLLLEYEDKTIKYFSDDIYGKTKTMYESTKKDILTLQFHFQEQQDGEAKFDLTGMSENADDYIKRMITRQSCNFKAIDRAMSKIDIKEINEKWELEDHLSILKTKWETIDKLHWELEATLKGSDESYYSMFLDIENKYDEMKKQINNKIWSTAHYQRSAPRIEVPEFAGSYTKWISFKDLFLETIHNNPTINKAQKMQHLKTRLRGEAERLVQHLSISAENYNSCWEILTQRYDNRRLQFTSYMNTMLNLPVIQQPDAFNLKRMHDVITECLNGLSNISVDTSTWGPVIVHLMSQKLDTTTYSEYIKDLHDHRELPNLADFIYFLESKFMAYETMKNPKKEVSTPQKPNLIKPFNQNNSYVHKTNTDYRKNYSKTYHTAYGHCPHCNGRHVLMQCPKFVDMDATQRNATVAKLSICKNCLFSHGNKECNSTKLCKECNKKHHTLLHNSKKTEGNKNISTPNQQPSTSTQMLSSNHLCTSEMEILLTTVQLKVKSNDGSYLTLRALLDQGSQVNLITENAAQLLRLPRQKLNAVVSGIGTVSGDCKGSLRLKCKSIYSEYSFETQALIMKKLTNKLPNSTFEKTNWPHLENLKLADPDFNVSRPVDLLLGADVYSEILLDGVLRGQKRSPIAQQTQLGWILCGKLKTLNCHVTLVDLTEIAKFWESEDIVTDKKDTNSDDQCEEYYQKTVQRDVNDRYIVRMPLNADFQKNLGKSKSTAISQFLQLEKRLEKNKKLALMYREFIKEYIDLKHMKPAAPTSTSSPECYLPHHGVLREQSTTTKLRVVFNASQKTTTGYSLNSLLQKGPNMQKDIQALILKWRSYQYAFTADIEKMYRCIWIADDQRPLQKIIWRDSAAEKLQEFELCTVTYGTKCAPWLAMRTLKQLALDDRHKYPAAANILLNEFYVDDVISGHQNLEEAKNLQMSLINLLKGGGMNLRKWSANHPSLLEQLTEDQVSIKTIFEFKAEDSTNMLGLGWNPNKDTFMFNWSLEAKSGGQATKRSLLSEISRLYDPLGWLSPITITAKLLFQKVWTSKLAWDEELPSMIRNEWTKFKLELSEVKKIKLDRWIKAQQSIELLGFCDASEKAYACVIYSRVRNQLDTPTITLLAAKTRVAPLSQKISLPRLELCGALLLSKLIEKTKEALSGYNLTVQAWCDSQVVLAWLQGDTSRWDKYVSNGVDKIKQIIPSDKWRYVKSAQNPADCASRGMLPSKLVNFVVWWQGPEFLKRQKT